MYTFGHCMQQCYFSFDIHFSFSFISFFINQDFQKLQNQQTDKTQMHATENITTLHSRVVALGDSTETQTDSISCTFDLIQLDLPVHC